ncbi:MAG: ISL3 family transposase [Anaerolineales bacterium]
MKLEVLLQLPASVTIDEVTLAPPGVVLRARLAMPSAACPICGQTSASVHSRYLRRAAEVPIAGVAVRVWFTVRRFFCRNSHCSRRTFTEQIPEWLAPRAQRSQRLREMQQRLGLALGGELGHRLTGPLAVAVSADTILRLIRQYAAERAATPRVLGIDDWAYRRGHHYGTLLVDHEQGRVVDLLPDREAATVANWLRTHPGVQTITRDRAQTYRDGVDQGAPHAQQVADRWHLLKNLRETMERYLDRHHLELRKVPLLQASTPTPVIATPVAATPVLKFRPLKDTLAPSRRQAAEARRARARAASLRNWA